jgi:type VI secretion system protein VasJ
MTPSTDSLRERATTWLQPISAETPCGVSSKHHPAYESVFAEVAKLESPTGDTVRWDEVVRGAGELLRQNTKDLWLASYFAYGMYVTEGLPGAITGTTLLAELTERYWEGLFPEASRLRSRGLALSWYVEHMSRVLPSLGTDGLSPEVVEALAASVSKLAEVTRARLASQGPALGPLVSGVERLRANLPKEASAPGGVTPTAAPAAAPLAASPTPATPVETPASPSPAPSAAPPQPATTVLASQLLAAPTSELASAEAATDFLRNVGSSLASAAAVLRRANPADPNAYRLLRTGLWLHVSQPPPTGATGRTSIPPLPPALRTKLETLATNTRWAELLDESESAMVQYRFALDLQRFSANALTSLGPTHAPAREALLLELTSLLKRMPTVMELVASDGTPLADAASKEWLQREVLAKPSAASRPRLSLPLLRETEVPAQAMTSEEDIQSLVSTGKTGEALALLQSHAASATTDRARFVARLRLARTCALAGQLSAARALYEALDAECTAHALDAWEPTLAAACLEGFLTCNTASKDSSEGLVGDDWIRYRRLAQLDPAAALRVQP